MYTNSIGIFCPKCWQQTQSLGNAFIAQPQIIIYKCCACDNTDRIFSGYFCMTHNHTWESCFDYNSCACMKKQLKKDNKRKATDPLMAVQPTKNRRTSLYSKKPINLPPEISSAVALIVPQEPKKILRDYTLRKQQNHPLT